MDLKQVSNPPTLIFGIETTNKLEMKLSNAHEILTADVMS